MTTHRKVTIIQNRLNQLCRTIFLKMIFEFYFLQKSCCLITRIHQCIRITVAPTVETTVNQDIWKAIQDALNKNHILQFDYTDRWCKQTEQRKLRPYHLVLDDGVCYLFGFDELRNVERIFSLVRMRNAVVTDEAFELP